MKILIDTDWFGAIQDLQPNKQKEVLLAILNYPNGHSDTNLWKKTILPNLEKGQIAYFNKLQNLKQNNPQKTNKKNTGSVSESGIGSVSESATDTTIREDKSRVEKSNITHRLDSLEYARAHVGDITGNNAYEILQALTPEQIKSAIKEQIVPILGAHLYTGEPPTDEILDNYILARHKNHWLNARDVRIRNLASDLAMWLKREKPKETKPVADEKDIEDFVKNWNKFAKAVKGADGFQANCTETAPDEVKDFIPAAKSALLRLMEQDTDKTRLITPKKPTDDIWAWALNVFQQRRYYSDFLYHECRITPKFFCTHIAELADPYCDVYLNDSEKYPHS